MATEQGKFTNASSDGPNSPQKQPIESIPGSVLGTLVPFRLIASGEVTKVSPKSVIRVPEIIPAKREAYQAFRKDRSTSSAEDILAVSHQIAAEPELHQKLIANPYSQEAVQEYTGRFSGRGMTFSDVIRATALAEPEGEYEKVREEKRKADFGSKFRKLPLPERLQKRREALLKRKEELFDEIDTSANMVVRLSGFTKRMDEDQNTGSSFLSLSDQHKFDLLSQTAFGTSDEEEIGRQFSQNQRRGIRLAIVNFIDDTHRIADNWMQMHDDLPGALEQLFQQTIEGSVTGEFTPFGIIFHLEKKSDYEKFGGAQTNAQTLYNESLPDELKGRIAIINGYSDSETARSHEIEHMIYEGFIEDAGSPKLRELDGKGLKEELQVHQQNAQELVRFHMSLVKDETIAYLVEGSSDSNYRSVREQLGGNQLFDYLESLREPLLAWENTSRKDVAAYSIYVDAFGTYLDQARRYQWIARKLDMQGRLGEKGLDLGGEMITREKAKALLKVTSPENAQRLGRYFDIEPESVGEAFAAEQQALVTELYEKIATNKPIDDDMFEKMRSMFPEKALPALLKIIDGSVSSDLWTNTTLSIQATENILHMHARHMSAEQLREVREALETGRSRAADGDSEYATRAEKSAIRLINYIDELAALGIIKEDSLRNAVEATMRTPDREEPTVGQITELAKMLEEKGSLWWKYFDSHQNNLYDILGKHEEGIPLLIKMAIEGPYFETSDRATASLRRHADVISPEIKPFVDEMVIRNLSRIDAIKKEDDELPDYVLAHREALRALQDRLQISPEQKTQAVERLQSISAIDPSELDAIESVEDFSRVFDGLGNALHTILLTSASTKVDTIFKHDEESGKDEFISYGLIDNRSRDTEKDASFRQNVIITRRKRGYINFGENEITKADGEYKNISWFSDIAIDRPIESSDFEGDTDQKTLQRSARNLQDFLKNNLSLLLE